MRMMNGKDSHSLIKYVSDSPLYNNCHFILQFAHLFVSLTFGLRYFRSTNQRKTSFPLVLCSLIRIFASALWQ